MTTTPTRLDRFRDRLPEYGLQAMLVTYGADIIYLSGFRASNGALLVTAEEQVLLTDFRYVTQAAEQAPDWDLRQLEPGQGLLTTVGKLLAEEQFVRVGFQSEYVTHDGWSTLLKELHQADHLIATKGVVQGLREVKEPGEVEAIRAAAAVADATMQRAWELARPGLTERQLKAELEYFMLQQGADRPSFDMILAGGPHSALPHAPISDRPLQTGDLLTIDLGAEVGGYCSDLTRTVCLGEPTDEQQGIYELVYRAQMAALAALQPGLTGKEVDEVARAIIRDAGHGDNFGHGLGHGVGIEIHEGPRLSVSGAHQLEVGHVVTVEPGVYVPGLGGVRIEDLVVVMRDGCELLSAAPKPAELLVL